MSPIVKEVTSPERSHECFPQISADHYGAGTVYECPKCGTQFKTINSVFEPGHSIWVILDPREYVKPDGKATTVPPRVRGDHKPETQRVGDEVV